jgi:UDP-MurNAc hydroxylase
VKVTWYTNACVRISASNGSNILCDPWVSGGAFLGSWFQWPPIPDGLGDNFISEPTDCIYITHLHPDHYDPKFLARFARHRPEVPIYIAEFAHEWLKRSVKAVVGDHVRVIEIPSLSEVEVAPGLSLKVFAADTCNPSVCGVSVPCQSNPVSRGIDSIGVFCADGFTVVNANDAMGVKLIPRVAANIGKADLLMGHYGGASPYPQCFSDVVDKKNAAKAVIESACSTLISAANALEVEYIMPFAGQYLLGGRLSHLNADRATLPLDEAVVYLRSITQTQVISVVPSGEFDLSTGMKSADYVEPSSNVLSDYLSKISEVKFSYEVEFLKEWVNPELDLIQAAKPILERSAFVNIGFSNSFIIGDGDNWVTINLDHAKVNSSIEIGKSAVFEDVTEILMPNELLRRLSTRKSGYRGFTPMHWNQADVGSHFIWKRIGKFDLVSHALLNFYGV